MLRFLRIEAALPLAQGPPGTLLRFPGQRTLQVLVRPPEGPLARGALLVGVPELEEPGAEGLGLLCGASGIA